MRESTASPAMLVIFLFSRNYTQPYFFLFSSSVLRLIPRIFADRPI